MIVRILNEGQWELDDSSVSELNPLDDAIEEAIDAGDQGQLTDALGALLDKVRSLGTVVSDDSLTDSDLILPDASATLDEVRDWLVDSGSGEGLIPG